MTEHGPAMERVRGQGLGDDEVDLALGQKQLDVAGALVVVRRDRQGVVAQSRVEKAEGLGVGQEDVDVLAAPVVQVEHQHGAAAERPLDVLAEDLRGACDEAAMPPRAAQPDQIAAAISWLACDEASDVNGALLTADGGWCAA